MKKTYRAIVGFLQFIILISIFNSSDATGLNIQTGLDEFINTERLSERVLLIRTGVNYFDAVTAVAANDGIVVFDAGYSPTLAAKYKKIIERELNRSDIVYLVNTHGHWDHTNGNKVFKEAVIVGHENSEKEIIEKFADKENFFSWLKKFKDRCIKSLESKNTNSEENRQLQCRADLYSMVIEDFERDFNYALPELTFSDKLSLNLNDVNLNMVYFGKAHSTSDILVFIPEEKLLMTGDLFNEGGSGNLSKLNHNEVSKLDIDCWHEALSYILQPENNIEKIIDGHGAILAKDDLRAFQNIVNKLWEDFNSGKTLSAKVRLKEVFNESGIEGMVNEYKEKMKTGDSQYYFYEGEFFDLAGHLSGDGETKCAIEIVKIIIDQNPFSWRAYDYLGDFYKTGGENELAIESFKKSLNLNPENIYAAEMLKLLIDN